MTYRIEKEIGGGGYGHVYKGHDEELHRDVAIKFIRTSAGDEEFAKEQARALCRCSCENVVTVFALAELEDPTVKTLKPALVMELVHGDTVLTLLTGHSLSLDDINRIGLGTINGLDYIHQKGLIHGDLSLDNVMASSDSVKIIDILYKHTLAGGDSETRDYLRLDDRNSLRSLLARLIRSVNSTQAEVFTKSLNPESTMAEIRTSFLAATDPKLIIDVPKKVEEWLRLFNESSFDDSEEYAGALSEDIPEAGIVPLLEAMIANGGIPKKRSRFVDRLWRRLDINGRRGIGAKLSEAIMREIPKGSFPPLLRMLRAMDKTGWAALSKLCRIRLERALIEDLKKGHYDNYNSLAHRGSFGTWTSLLFPFFDKPDEVLDAIVTLLNGGWYTQNYVGEYFMRILPRLVKKPEDRQRLITGVASAVENDAFRVRKNLSELPVEWQEDIKKEKSEEPDASEAEEKIE